MRKNLMFFCLATLLATGAIHAQDQAAADTLFKAQDWEGAVAAYRTLTETTADDGQAWFRLGQAQFQLKRYDDALASYAKAIANGVPQASYQTAVAHAAKGDGSQALVWLGKLADAGANVYGAVKNNPVFQPLAENSDFKDVLARLKPCNSDAYRQFDFWLGTWDVASAGSPAGSGGAINRITRAQDGCALLENYTNGAYAGQSVNLYNKATDTWHQTWVDNQGVPLFLSGGIENGKMVLRSAADQPPINRITWTPNEDGSVRQLWQTSSDGGATWQVAFDGLYTKRADD